jgi:GNAT superfamily N-acetyltransferase
MAPGSRAADPVMETGFQPPAAGQLLDLWHQVMPGDAPDQARFRDLALLNPAFAPEGLIMLWRGPRLIGFGLAIADPACPDPACPGAAVPRRGWLVAMGVVPDEQGAGHGTRLLESCLRFLADCGCAVAELGGNGERYLLPGCDPVAYPAFHRLVQGRGFRPAGGTDAMECDLREIRPARAPADSHPYDYRHPADADIPELLRVISALSPSWAALVRGYLARTLDADSLWVAYGFDRIAGFAGFDLFPGCPGRFGPMGVLPEVRGQGVGARLLGLSLASMAHRGHRSAWFLWGPEGSAGPRMYASAGFRVNRRFECFKRDLQAPAVGRTTKERQS